MIVLIEHPEHGRTHVYTDSELEAHKALGWFVVEPKKEEPKPEKKKPGRPKKDK